MPFTIFNFKERKTLRRWAVVMAVGGAALLSGCVVAPVGDGYTDYGYSSSTIYTNYGYPPPARIEYRTVAPGPNYLWLAGDWYWTGGFYDWRPGRWVAPGYRPLPPPPPPGRPHMPPRPPHKVEPRPPHSQPHPPAPPHQAGPQPRPPYQQPQPPAPPHTAGPEPRPPHLQPDRPRGEQGQAAPSQQRPAQARPPQPRPDGRGERRGPPPRNERGDKDHRRP